MEWVEWFEFMAPVLLVAASVVWLARATDWLGPD